MKDLETQQKDILNSSLDELVKLANCVSDRYKEEKIKTNLILGAILLEGRNRFETNESFLDWMRPNFGQINKQRASELMNLTRFFVDNNGINKNIEGLGLSVMYAISAPKNKTFADKVYEESMEEIENKGKLTLDGVKKIIKPYAYALDAPNRKKREEDKKVRIQRGVLNGFLEDYIRKKNLSKDDKLSLKNIVLELNNENYEYCKEKMLSSFETMKDCKLINEKKPDNDSYEKWKKKNYGDNEKAVEDANAKNESAISDIISNLASASVEPIDALTSGNIIGQIIGGKENVKMNKAILKIMKQYLHPDKGGSEEKFNLIMKTQEFLL